MDAFEELNGKGGSNDDTRYDSRDEVWPWEGAAYEAGARLARICAAPVRLEILGVLAARAASVTEIATALELDLAHVSHHLASLRETELVGVDRDGKRRIYGLGAGAELRREAGKLVLRSGAETAAEFILRLENSRGRLR